MRLKVFLKDKKCGTLYSTADKGIVFEYDSDYSGNVENHSLSVSLPLSKKNFTQKECIPFFYGLLPEGDIKKRIAAELHVSETSTIKLLDALGGECAGTVSLFNEENASNPPEEAYLFCKENYHPISEEEIAEKIKNCTRTPVIRSEKDYRLSLAGAQEKIALAFFDGNWYVPLNGAPSTHILKPSRSDYPDLCANEYISMKIAEYFIENVPKTRLLSFGKKELHNVFCIERYDREITIKDNEIRVKRIHQEDFCQALGIMSDNKYQNDGGPGLVELMDIIRDNSSSPVIDIQKCAEYFLFNFLIGNCDAHGKNYSLLYRDGVQLAPAYDIVSTVVYPDLSKKLSMKIGHYEIDKVTRAHITETFDKARINVRILNKIFEKFAQKATKLDEILSGDKIVENNKDLANKIVDRLKNQILNNYR